MRVFGIPAAAFVLGIVAAFLALWAYTKYTDGKVTTPALDTVIDLNPAIYPYPGASSISGGPN